MKFITFLSLLFLSANCFLFATPITGLNAIYKNGQVFFTWTNLPSTGIEYRLYKSSSPIVAGNQLASCEYLGAVYDSSSVNRSLSEAEEQNYFLKIDSLGSPLNGVTGLFVATSTQNGNFYYALTTSVAGNEDTAIIPGDNSLTSPVTEEIDYPKPVYQLTLTINNKHAEVYVLYTSQTSTPLFPQMVHVGSYPFDFSLVKNGTATLHPLNIKISGGGASFLSGIVSGLQPTEYRIGLDDWLPNGERSTWFGYHEQYNILNHQNTIPVSGVNHDYAFQRLQYIIDWATRCLPVDTNRIYMQGASAGAGGVLLTYFLASKKVTAVSMNVPKFDLSFLHDPDTTNNYNEGHPGRLRIDTLMGTVLTNLPTNQGPATYDLLNGGWLAHQHAFDDLPILFAINGKKDTMVGWAEKIAYYDSVNANRLGGTYFWDMRDHGGDNGYWVGTFDLFRFNHNLSYPAFSNCTANDNPGDGHVDSGDSVGTINGFLDWKDGIVDDTNQYEISVFMKTLTTIGAPVSPPDTCFTDVTIRRFQNFDPPLNSQIEWEVIHNGQVIQSDSFLYTGGLITIEGVKIYKDTSVIHIAYSVPTGIENNPVCNKESFSLFPNPASSQITVVGNSEISSSYTITVEDLQGRKIYSSSSTQNSFSWQHSIDVSDFPSGIYLVRVNGLVKRFVKE